MHLPYLKCSFPGCTRTVGQHNKKTNANKTMCSYHRTAGKHAVDLWKMNNGCANKDSHYGFPCVVTDILSPDTLDVNHIDGNNLNRDESNIEILCKMCHTRVTRLNGHHMPKPNRVMNPILNTELFEFVVRDGYPKLNRVPIINTELFEFPAQDDYPKYSNLLL
jgi:hypothetical protein